jgi:hypothetical protein
MALDFRGPHAEFLADETPEQDLEGARYSGKTWACSAKVGRYCTKFPGMEWLMGRFSNEETRTKVRPEFVRVIGLDQQLSLEWDDDASCYLFPDVGGLRSKVYAYGLKSQSIVEALSKVRGLGVAGIWNDQSEELPQAVSEELRFGTRQPGFPHRLIFSPNPPNEDHFLADQFPEENPMPHRRYRRVSLYDNQHNLAEGKIAELEALYPPTHAKYKSLILGMRGPNVVGVPVYDGLFNRAQHVGAVTYAKQNLLLEAIHSGQHHPIWVCAQFSASGGLELLGGLMGKRMMLEDFLPLVNRYRLEWFDPDESQVRLCSDPPPSADDAGMRFTALDLLRDAGLKPRSKANATAPDVREAVIQNLATLMRRYRGFTVNRDPTRWLTVSKDVTKQSKSLVDALEGSYVWDEHFVSVSNKTVRKPKSDQWLDGWMRCVENIALNFCTLKTPKGQDNRPRPQPTYQITRPDSWLGS